MTTAQSDKALVEIGTQERRVIAATTRKGPHHHHVQRHNKTDSLPFERKEFAAIAVGFERLSDARGCRIEVVVSWLETMGFDSAYLSTTDRAASILSSGQRALSQSA